MEALLTIDGNILLFIQEHIRNDILTPFMQVITKLGDYKGLILILFVLALLIIKGTRRTGICCAVAMALSGIFSNLIIKNIVGRTRPYDLLPDLTILVDKPSDTSFPSGHASLTATLAVALLLSLSLIMSKKLARGIGIGAICIALIVGFSRLYLGVHFPSDVIAGLILGVVYGILGNLIGRWLAGKLPQSWFNEIKT